MKPRIPIAAWVALGSALGAGARWGTGIALGAGGAGFPWGTLAVNVAGSALIGFYAALVVPGSRFTASPAQRQFVMAGFCGGFTTFSLFTIELLEATLQGRYALAAAILVGSVSAWLVAVTVGYLAGTRLAMRPARAERGDPNHAS
ncbi:fluoride efflux transporter FluC [Luteimonas suaedae]|uniref:fluoride efflux transporter FluC n=1 Tax=Luteimonas suaedae TaxID=2605430 RepID=UPI0011F09824|nr:CrcB family protein [Luteimonas suaedae]